MLSSTTHSQKISSSDYIINDISIQNPNIHLSEYLNKIKADDIEKVKVYLGMVYFVVFSVVSAAVLF